MGKLRRVCHFLPVVHALLSILGMLMGTVDVAVGSKQEGDVLKELIASADPEGKVAKQWGGEDPCTAEPAWPGVSCAGGSELNVRHLILENKNLSGFIPEGTLSLLAHLRVLSFKGNGLTGQIPADLIMCAQLTHLYMQNNALSGPIPSPLSHHLKRIDLSNNKLSGNIPSSFADIEGLLTLFLESNMLEGGIPALHQQSLVQFNVSNNNLSGEIPSAEPFRRFSADVFVGNAFLCGSPLQACAIELAGSENGTIASSQIPLTRNKLTTGKIVAIILASMAFVLIAIGLIFCCYKRRLASKGLQNKVNKKVAPSGLEDLQSISTASAGDDDKPRLVFFEDTNTFRLDKLLRASAEFLGKGSLGCAYKAVMEDGRMMCVKRLKELKNMARSEFEKQMQLVGRVRHPNVVPLWAYYYAKEEKLLVYEYEPNGNLQNLLLAGERRQGEAGGENAITILKPLSWNARLRIAKSMAKGLAYLHESSSVAHGNIKASNILIGKDYEVLIADFGLASLLTTSLSPDGGPRAPDAASSRQDVAAVQATQKADVYSFGVLLLELLTGRVQLSTAVQDSHEYDDMNSYAGTRDSHTTFNLPQWVTSVVKEEWSVEVFDKTLMAASSDDSLISMLQIAMACTSTSPEQRPHMTHVCQLIAAIHEEDDHMINMASSVSTSVEQASSFHFISSDDSTMTSTHSPYYEDREASFRF